MEATTTRAPGSPGGTSKKVHNLDRKLICEILEDGKSTIVRIKKQDCYTDIIIQPDGTVAFNNYRPLS